MTRRRTRYRFVSWALLAAACAAQTLTSWRVPDALLRFDFCVESRPSHPSAGLLVFLPDGGILAENDQPGAQVFDENGRSIEFETLWHNRQEGMGLVIAPPTTTTFSVYISRRSRLAPNTRSSFTPGPLLYVQEGQPASLEAAQRMAAPFPPGGRNALMGPVTHIGHQFNPLGDDDHYAAWYVAWLSIAKPGRYYFATISDEGSLVTLNGRTVAEWPGLHTRHAGAKGQFGSWIDLPSGLHRVDYFHFEQTGPQEAQLVWKTPEMTNTLPVMVPASAFARSGSTRLIAVAEREGGPVSLPKAHPLHYLWFGQKPLNLFRLEAGLATNHPRDAIYEWRLEEGVTVREPAFDWLFEGSQPRTAVLTVRWGRRSSIASCTIRLPVPPARARVDLPTHRVAYRTALLNRCRAVSSPARPAANWSADLWQLVGEVVEPLKGHALLTELFERSRDDILRQPPALRYLLEDLYVENLTYADPTNAVQWLVRMENEEREASRKRQLALQRVEALLYRIGQTNDARRLAQSIATQAPGTPEGVLAVVRLGDMEALAGQIEAARAFYARAQQQSQKLAQGASGGPSPSTADPSRRAPPLARSREEMAQQRERRTPNLQASPARPGTLRPVEPWKAETVRGGTYYATVRSLLDQGYLREAREQLRQWEMELPVEKLGGDFPVAEAEYFMAIRDYPRALLILQTYRSAVDMSAWLLRVMSMELQCLNRLNRTDDMRARAAEIVRRFPGTTAADEARRLLLILEKQPASPFQAAPRVEM
jgi:hypothetical protein